MWDGPSGCELCGLVGGVGCWAKPEWVLQGKGTVNGHYTNFCDSLSHMICRKLQIDSVQCFDIPTSRCVFNTGAKIILFPFPLSCPHCCSLDEALGRGVLGPQGVFVKKTKKKPGVCVPRVSRLYF